MIPNAVVTGYLRRDQEIREAAGSCSVPITTTTRGINTINGLIVISLYTGFSGQ